MNVIALDASFAALARFDARELFDLAVILLNLPTHGTHLSSVLRRRLRGVVCHDVIRAVGRHRHTEQLHFRVFGKAVNLNGFARF